MALPPRHLDWMLGQGATAEEKYEILRLNDCLSPEALTNKTDVIAFIRQKTDMMRRDYARYLELTRDQTPKFGGGQFSAMRLDSALEEAGYLNERGIRISRKTFDPRLPIRLPDGDFKYCGDTACRKLVRVEAKFCQYCARRIDPGPTNDPLNISLPQEVRYCGRCKTRVGLEDKFCSRCGYDFISCPSCGASLAADAKFCRYCGPWERIRETRVWIEEPD